MLILLLLAISVLIYDKTISWIVKGVKTQSLKLQINWSITASCKAALLSNFEHKSITLFMTLTLKCSGETRSRRQEMIENPDSFKNMFWFSMLLSRRIVSKSRMETKKCGSCELSIFLGSLSILFFIFNRIG